MRVFTGNAHPGFARATCESIGLPLGRAEVGRFPDSEIKVHILEDVRGTDAFVIQPTCAPVNENLMELLVIMDALRRASAERITAVIPYFGYARQDRKHEGRVPITAKLVANLLVSAGASRVLAVDLHATQLQGFFDVPVDHIFAKPVLVQYIEERAIPDLAVLSDTGGGLKMANSFAKRLKASFALIDKRRVGDEEVEHSYVVGEVKDKNVVIVDDMITTATSLCAAARAVKGAGARSVWAAATHGIFCGKAFEKIAKAGFEEVIVTDTIPTQEPLPGVSLKVLSVAGLLGEAMKRTHMNESVSQLFLD